MELTAGSGALWSGLLFKVCLIDDGSPFKEDCIVLPFSHPSLPGDGWLDVFSFVPTGTIVSS